MMYIPTPSRRHADELALELRARGCRAFSSKDAGRTWVRVNLGDEVAEAYAPTSGHTGFRHNGQRVSAIKMLGPSVVQVLTEFDAKQALPLAELTVRR